MSKCQDGGCLYSYRRTRRSRRTISLRSIIEDIEELVEVVAVPIHNQQMAVLAAAPIDVAWIATLDPMWLGDRLRRDRIEWEDWYSRVIHPIAVVPANANCTVVDPHG